jgi:hypothetical protein
MGCFGEVQCLQRRVHGTGDGLAGVHQAPIQVEERRAHQVSLVVEAVVARVRARANTASSISSVSRPVNVFCWLT